MKLIVKGQAPSEPTVEFRLEREDEDVNIFANDDLIGWFRVIDGKVAFFRSFPSTASTREAFGPGMLTVKNS